MSEWYQTKACEHPCDVQVLRRDIKRQPSPGGKVCERAEKTEPCECPLAEFMMNTTGFPFFVQKLHEAWGEDVTRATLAVLFKQMCQKLQGISCWNPDAERANMLAKELSVKVSWEPENFVEAIAALAAALVALGVLTAAAVAAFVAWLAVTLPACGLALLLR